MKKEKPKSRFFTRILIWLGLLATAAILPIHLLFEQLNDTGQQLLISCATGSLILLIISAVVQNSFRGQSKKNGTHVSLYELKVGEYFKIVHLGKNNIMFADYDDPGDDPDTLFAVPRVEFETYLSQLTDNVTFVMRTTEDDADANGDRAKHALCICVDVITAAYEERISSKKNPGKKRGDIKLSSSVS